MSFDPISYSKAKSVQEQLDQAIQEGDQLAETQQARVDNTGFAHTTLKARLDNDFSKTNQKIDDVFTAHDDAFTAHLAESAQKHITESGENANGRYVRFDDGTQICWRTTSITGDSWSNSAWGGKYKNGVVNLPVSFLSGAIPIYSNQDDQVSARGSWSINTTMSGTSAVSIWLGAFGSSDFVAKGNLMVIGRWK